MVENDVVFFLFFREFLGRVFLLGAEFVGRCWYMSTYEAWKYSEEEIFVYFYKLYFWTNSFIIKIV